MQNGPFISVLVYGKTTIRNSGSVLEIKVCEKALGIDVKYAMGLVVKRFSYLGTEHANLSFGRTISS
jgi:hypothetical protein